MTTDPLSTIARRSRGLPRDRTREALSVLPETGNSAPLVAAWSEALGGAVALRRRLRWGGIRPGELRAAASRQEEGDAAELSTIGEVVAASSDRELADSQARARRLALVVGEPPPFAEVWAGTVRLASERLGDVSRRRFAPPALEALESWLLLRLARVGELALYQRFKRRRDADATPGAHRRFVAEMSSGEGLAALFAEYSCLARQVARIAIDWTEAVDELALRLERDEGLLRKWNAGRALGRALGAHPGLADAHAGGRSVVRLRFSGGLELYYKPRPVELELALCTLLEWMQRRGGPTLPRAEVVAGDGYGWMRGVVGPASFEDRRDVERYFFRAGGLVFVAWALRATDLHWGNVVASAEGPVVVDAETFCSPSLAHGAMARHGHTSSFGLDHEVLAESVIAPGLLRLEQSGSGGERYDVGGLSGPGGHCIPRRRIWRGVGRDGLMPLWKAGEAPRERNLPGTPSGRATPRDHGEALRDGFATAYRWFVRNRSELLAEQGPLRDFRAARARVLPRTSDFYAGVLQALSMPAQQRTAHARSLALEGLYRPLLGAARRPPAFDLVEHEQRSLDRGDLPYFLIRVDPDAASHADAERSAAGDGDRAMAQLFAGQPSAWQLVVERIGGLDDDDLATQTAVIDLALHAPSRIEVTSADVASGWRFTADERLGSETLRAEVERIVDRLEAWLAEPVGSRRPQAGTLASSLYLGDLGIAVFLAEAGRWLEAPGASTSAARRGSAARQVLLRACQGDLGDLGAGRLGALTGVGSRVLGLLRGAAALDDPELSAAAAELALRTDAEADAVAAFDLDSGLAGWVLALCAIAEASGLDRLYDCAFRRGLELLSRSRCDGHGVFWTAAAPADGDGRLGLAHGNSGVALALTRLFSLSGYSPFSRAAAEAIAWEDARFSPALGDWPLEAAPQQAGSAVAATAARTWCNGAPGMAVARAAATAAGIELGSGSLQRAEVATRYVPVSAVDHVCCGNLGLVDAMLTVAEATGDETVRRAAEMRAAIVVSRARARCAERLGEGAAELAALGYGVDGSADQASGEDAAPGAVASLFRGLAGVGTVLLRLQSGPASLTALEVSRRPSRPAAVDRQICEGIDFQNHGRPTRSAPPAQREGVVG